MVSSERRNKITEVLQNSDKPVSASRLAELCGVSRQIIVGDIALIRAGGTDIQATPRGYVMSKVSDTLFEGCIACTHSIDELEEEIYTILDFGGEIKDVTITHPIYGEISAYLHLSSRYDAKEFFDKIANAKPLFTLSEDGVHLHRIICKNEEIFRKIENELDKKGILYKNTD